MKSLEHALDTRDLKRSLFHSTFNHYSYFPMGGCVWDPHQVLYYIVFKVINRRFVSFLFLKTFKMFLNCNYLLALLHHENPLHTTLSCSAVEALRVIELPRHEYLLVFSSLAAYVDRHGRRSREREIMYPALPTGIS